MPSLVVPVAPKEKDALVEELLERSQRRGTSEDLDQLVRQVVAPHLAPRAPAERDALLARADEAISSWMRELLRAPGFRDLEAAWRALDFLVRRVDEDSTEVHVLDVSRGELAEDLRRKDLSESGAYKILVEDAVETSGGKPWSVVVGMWDFSPSVEDAALLGRLARLAQAAGAPFLAAAAPALAGQISGQGRGERVPDADPAREALWQALRGMTGAEAVGLAFPRILLRLPYGAATDPAEEFPFEEVDVEVEGKAARDASPEDRLLWGNPAIACALLLSQAFAQDGWDMTPGSVRDVDDLPLYVHERGDGEKRLTPCAETALSDAEAEALVDRGLIPLVTRRGSDSVRVLRFQSIREPAAPLAGPWASGGS
jgi:type VI secretion system protein ImpC